MTIDKLMTEFFEGGRVQASGTEGLVLVDVPLPLPDHMEQLRQDLLQKLADLDRSYRKAAEPIILDLARLEAQRPLRPVFVPGKKPRGRSIKEVVVEILSEAGDRGATQKEVLAACQKRGELFKSISVSATLSHMKAEGEARRVFDRYIINPGKAK